jgi:hypothetical protein
VQSPASGGTQVLVSNIALDKVELGL